jgi:hypothetical protein
MSWLETQQGEGAAAFSPCERCRARSCWLHHPFLIASGLAIRLLVDRFVMLTPDQEPGRKPRATCDQSITP